MPHQLLLADESVTIQRVIKLTLADEDVNVTTVSDGNQAVAAIDRAPPDIVLADVSISGRNGYEIARHVRETPRLAHIPVVLLTGVFDPIDEAQALAVGCDRVLAKPFDPQGVISCVRELLARPMKIAVPLEGNGRAETATQAPAEIDAYFDRLDLAFAILAEPPLPQDVPRLEGLSVESDEDLNQSGSPTAPSVGLPAAAPDPLPLGSQGTATDHLTTPAHNSPASAPEMARAGLGEPTSIGSAHVTERGIRSVVESFDTLRPAEQLPSVAATAPLQVIDPSTPVHTLSDELIEEIVTRVLNRLTARLSSVNVADIVTSVADRLVRAEIDRIKDRL